MKPTREPTDQELTEEWNKTKAFLLGLLSTLAFVSAKLIAKLSSHATPKPTQSHVEKTCDVLRDVSCK